MNRKHFIAAAAKIRSLNLRADAMHKAGDDDGASRCRTKAAGCEDFCLELFREFGPNFNSCRFIEACRPE